MQFCILLFSCKEVSFALRSAIFEFKSALLLSTVKYHFRVALLLETILCLLRIVSNRRFFRSIIAKLKYLLHKIPYVYDAYGGGRGRSTP